MTATPEATRARQYLLGQSTDDESAVIEQEYLEHEEAVERIAAAEDDLIEDYLSGQLNSSERESFEREYLSVPHHRVRVETVRRLMAHSSRAGLGGNKRPHAWTSIARQGRWLALAATIVAVASIALWRSSSSDNRPAEISQTSPSAEAPTQPIPREPPAPRVFAVTLSAAAVRGGADSASVVVPSGTDVVAIRLQPDDDNRKLIPRRASIQTVAGAEQWQGPAAAEGDAPRGTVARVEVPAASLPPDDYVLILFGTDPSGVEREWTRYFLPVRAQR